MKGKKVLSLALAATMSLSLLSACGGGNDAPAGASNSPTGGTPSTGGDLSGTTIQVAAIETSYGTEVWQQVAEAFTAQTGINVELVTDKKLEDVIGPAMQGGEYPDVIHLAVGREAGLTEQFIKDKNIAEITDVLSMTVPGEDVTVGDKIIPGFVNDNSTTNPYADGKTYLAPMFYSPCGLFYNKGLFEEKGWEVPTTWDEMWELGDKAAAEGISLFTYPTTGYFDAFFYALMYEAGGEDFFFDATHYAEGIWDSAEAQTCFDIVEKLASYTNPITPAQANDQDFTQNQQLVLDNKALFMPNGTWIVGEMAEAPRADGFEWGMTALPAITEGGDRYSYTFFEQMWIPAGAANVDAAKQFIAFMYSDTAVDLFASAGAAQPVTGIVDKLSGDNQIFYGIYDDGAMAALGAFASYKSVAGLGTVREVFFDPVNSLVSGSMTKDEWVSSIKAASDQMRANLS
ncbi:carbohydrate ABC transporter substrate-binding protein [Pseudoflavonifractor phocaeensis]|uniref:carbohydrate ABC transporter substrate-binding protein n=1 Tax=Pseudoflavonifractor phocaeensis TaxID=1870988 RepID=UPI00195EC230|nr:carbohydrate ABC transporter substrate-binding protein [Pseudoflavonifractor phocaeensis]MBM6886766.1 carbohydrate ABC transporter substrate-binding protein [Pseudoflavonifractor phocaeensis]